MFFLTWPVNATIGVGPSRLGTAEQRRRAILRSRVLGVIVRSEPGDSERVSIAWAIRSTNSIRALRALATSLSPSARRSHVGASEIAIEMSTRIWCARPSRSRPSGTWMSLGRDGSPLMLPGEHISNRVASDFIVLPIIHSCLERRDQLALRIEAAAPDAGNTIRPYIVTMPQHDLPDGHETRSNVIDFRKRLRPRSDTLPSTTDHAIADESDQNAYRHAEHSDGKRPGFGRYDVLWLGLIASLGWMLWYLVLR